MKYKLHLFLAISFIYTNTIDYKINFYGLNVAKCKMQIEDTVIYKKECVKIEYFVESTNFMKWLFNVDNHYITIIDKNNHNIVYYNKKSTQPNVNNLIFTNYLDGEVFYNKSSLQINNSEYNIFSLLYDLSFGKTEFTEEQFVIDREGKKYFGKINLVANNSFSLDTFEINSNNDGVEKFTDIFSWALFLPNTSKIINIDIDKNIVSSCTFNKGVLKFSAEFIE